MSWVSTNNFAKTYVDTLKSLGYEDKVMISQLTTTFAYEPVDKLSDEIERLEISNKALIEPITYMKERLQTKKDTRTTLNDTLNKRFEYYFAEKKLTAKRAKALALIDTDAVYQTQQIVNELKYPSDLAVLSESRLAHKTRGGDKIINRTAQDDADDMVIT